MIYDFKNKLINIRQSNNYMLAKTLTMFEWENLPDTIPKKELEKLLQVNGFAFITKVKDELYAFSGGLGGVQDAYGNPTEITVNNVHLDFNKTLSLKDDGVLILNDDLMIGLMPLFEKYNTMLNENDINMVLHGFSTRMKTLISASDDKTKQSAETYIKKVIDGEISIIGENAMFDGVKVQGVHSSQGTSVTQMTEYHQYLKASLYNEIGLSANVNMKRERLVSAEVEQGEDSLFPYVFNMMQNRLTAVKQINTMFETEINVDFGSVWSIKNKKLVDDIIDPLTSRDEPLNEPLNEPLETPPLDDNEGDKDEQITMVGDSAIDSGSDKEQSQAKTIDELMELLEDENLTDDDIKAIDELIAEIEDKKDD